MKYGNLTLGQVEALVNKIGGMDVVTSILRGTTELSTNVINCITHTFTVPVDETKTVEDFIAEGDYDWSNDDITSKNFPLPENGTKKEEKEITLFHFNKTMTSEQVIAEMDKDGYRPATIHELLALGIAQPDLQRQFPIIALGSACLLGSDRHVAILYRSADERDLFLHWSGLDWGGFCRFVAVRK